MTRSSYIGIKPAQLFILGSWSLSIVLPLAFVTLAVAQDKVADVAADESESSDSDREPKPRRVESPMADPLSVPNKDDWREERQRRDEKTLFAPSPASPQEQQRRHELAKQFEQLKRQHEGLVKERTRLEQEFRRVMAQIEDLKQQGKSESEAKKAELQRAMAEQKAAHAQMAEMAARQQRHVQLPPGSMTKVFSLRHSQAAESARVLSEILGGQPLRIAVDERTNSLIVMADEETGKMVEALLLRLDQSTRDTKRDQPGETLQLRIVWLLDGDLGMPPTDHVSPEVVEALHELGFKDPEVVCQQVATFTLSPNNREGQFDFHVPVLVKSQPWQFQGQGQVQPTGEERFNLRFDLRFSQVDPSSGRTRSGESGQLGGSIHTPLGHYTVMGTTTFVTAVPVEGFTSGGPKKLEPRQHLSAFVVYLDRAREFPAPRAPSQQPK